MDVLGELVSGHLHAALHRLGSVANRDYLPLAHANCDIRVPEWLTVALGDITREAVLAAIAEYDRLGQEAFLHRHGFDRARQYVLLHDGKRYDSKAIVGVAHGYLPGEAMLTSSEFSGGRATVGRLLTGLGFHVEEGDEQPGLRPGDWTEAENRAIVDDYLAMLALECAGKPYSKTEHRNALIEAMGGPGATGRLRGSTRTSAPSCSSSACRTSGATSRCLISRRPC